MTIQSTHEGLEKQGKDIERKENTQKNAEQSHDVLLFILKRHPQADNAVQFAILFASINETIC